MAPIPPPRLLVHLGEHRRTVVLQRGRGEERDVSLPPVFTAQYDLGGTGLVELEIRAETGRLRVTRVSIEERGADGVDGVSLGGVPIRRLVDRAASSMASFGAGRDRAMTAVQKASRRRLSDDRLRLVADAFTAGGIQAVMDSEHVAERQAWRLKRAAVEKGFLDGEH